MTDPRFACKALVSASSMVSSQHSMALSPSRSMLFWSFSETKKATQTPAWKRAAAPSLVLRRSCDVLQSIRFGDAAVPCRHRRDQIIAHAFIETDQALWCSRVFIRKRGLSGNGRCLSIQIKSAGVMESSSASAGKRRCLGQLGLAAGGLLCGQLHDVRLCTGSQWITWIVGSGHERMG